MIVRIRIWLLIGFFTAFGAYTLYEVLKPFWENCFYVLTCASFVAYTRVIYLCSINPNLVKHAFKGYWRIPALVIHLTTINALIDELFFDPTEININEYISFVVLIGIVLYQRNKWIR